jgi:hypothetical protein
VEWQERVIIKEIAPQLIRAQQAALKSQHLFQEKLLLLQPNDSCIPPHALDGG